MSSQQETGVRKGLVNVISPGTGIRLLPSPKPFLMGPILYENQKLMLSICARRRGEGKWSRRTLAHWEAACSPHSRLSSALELEFRKDRSVYWLLSCVQLFTALWTVACQTILSLEFSRQEYWSGLPFPSPGGMTRGALKSLRGHLPPPQKTQHIVLVAQSYLTICNFMD